MFAILDSPSDLLIILVVVVLLFGSARLPKLARSLGEAKAELEKGARDAKANDTKAADKPAEKPSGDSSSN